MAENPQHSDQQEHALISVMTLFATLTAATEVGRYVRERRAGLDPSGQEEESVVRPALQDAAGSLRELVLQLRTSLLFYAEHEPHTLFARARRFLDVMRLRQLARELQRVHQRLLSLYPAVTEAHVEASRTLTTAASATAHADHEAFVARLESLLDRLDPFISALNEAI